MASTSTKPHTVWTQTPTDDLTPENIPLLLASISDDVWVTAACLDRSLDVNDTDIQRALLTTALERTQSAIERGKEAIFLSVDDQENVDGDVAMLEKHWTAVPADVQLCLMRGTSLRRLDRLNTWVEMCAIDSEGGDEDDDPWADNSSQDGEPSRTAPSIPLSSFLVDPLIQSACTLVYQSHYDGIKILFTHHLDEIWPFRFAILNCVPAYEHPSQWKEILPAVDSGGDLEAKPVSRPWRSEPDWVETRTIIHVLRNFDRMPSHQEDSNIPPQQSPLSYSELTDWYKSRVSHVIALSGMIDVALATIQHGASNGVSDLDELGEDLSLLSRLVYDAPQPPDIFSSQEEWTLDRWRAMQPSEVVRAYLMHCTPENVAYTISKLVLPYLFVLEVRSERLGLPDPGLPNRFLYEYILTAPLEIATAIFEASKPTMPPAQRIVKYDEDLVRLALACIYGSNTRTEWATMSRIFECLPAWDVSEEDDDDEAETTVASLGAFVTPTTGRPRCTASDLLIFFKPLPKSSLSRALDILDVHLESGEILTRWNVPALPQWFLQSANDVTEQRAWANRMARRAGQSDNQMNGKDDWEWLLSDMIKLAGTGEGNLKGAFGLLSKDEVTRIFFSGLMTSGDFEVAKEMLRQKTNKLPLKPQTVEEICLASSRELYDNANSGNYKFGDMKLAYDCLNVPKQSPTVVKEKEFIEATSRIASFNVMSRPGIPVSPIEIRLTKDRLTLVSRVLASNADAYKHTEVIIDLVHKLGFRNDVVAEVKTLAMLADAALLADDFDRTLETSQKMVNTVHALRKSRGLDDPQALEASEVCWIACFQLGRHPEFDELDKKLSLIGRALELCPPEKIHEILAVWARLDTEDLEARKERIQARKDGTNLPLAKPQVSSVGSPMMSLANRLQGLQMPGLPSSPLSNTEDAAAMASRAFSRVSANFLGGRAHSPAPSDGARSASREGTRKRDEASRVLQKGIGWLIGADD